MRQTGPRTEGYPEGGGRSGFEGSGNSLDSGLFGILAKNTPCTYIREVRETEADTGGSSGRYLLAGEVNVHPRRVQSLYPDPLREEVNSRARSRWLHWAALKHVALL